MRNLKKILALVLALMMTLSLMVTASADFTDQDDIQYQEAVAVMTGLGILNGVGDGSFAPTRTLTRAEAAKIIAYMLETKTVGDTMQASVAAFEDVPAGQWYSGPILYCANAGIISGTGNGRFEPFWNVNGYSFGKMVLLAAQIGEESDYTGDAWAISVSSALTKNGIVSGMNLTLSDELTREQACEMAWRAMNINSTGVANTYLVTVGTVTTEFTSAAEAYFYAHANGDVAVTVKTGSIAGRVYNLQHTTGVVTANQATASTNKYTTIGGQNYDVETGLDLIGHNVTVYYRGGTAPFETYTVTDNSTTYTITAATTDADIAAAMGLATLDGHSWSYTPYDGAYTAQSTSTTAIDKDSTGTLVIYNKDVIAVIAPVTYTLDKVTNISEDGKTYTFYNNGTAANREVANLVLHDAIAKDDYVVVNQVNTIYHVSKAQTVTGTPSKIDATNNVVTIGGVTYSQNSNNNSGLSDVTSGMDFAHEYTLYLDGQGKYFAATGVAVDPGAPELYYVVAAYNVDAGGVDQWGNPVDVKHYVQLVDLDGNQVIKETEDDMATPTDSKDPSTAPINDYKDLLCTLSTNNDGQVDGFTTAAGTAAVVVDDLAAAVSATAPKIANNHYYASNVKFIYIKDDKADLKISVQGVQALDQHASIIYTLSGDGTNKTVEYVIVRNATYAPAPVSGSGVMFAAETAAITAKVPATNPTTGAAADGYEHTVYIDGVKTTITTLDSAAITGFKTYTVGDNGVYTITGNNTATNLKTASKITNMFNGLLTNGEVTDKSVAGATVVNLTNKNVPTDPTKLTTDDTVALVLDANGAVVTIYVTASART